MRFMMMIYPKGYEAAAPGTMPDPAAVAAMMKYNESFPADVQEAAAGLPELQARSGQKAGA